MGEYQFHRYDQAITLVTHCRDVLAFDEIAESKPIRYDHLFALHDVSEEPSARMPLPEETMVGNSLRVSLGDEVCLTPPNVGEWHHIYEMLDIENFITADEMERQRALQNVGIQRVMAAVMGNSPQNDCMRLLNDTAAEFRESQEIQERVYQRANAYQRHLK